MRISRILVGGAATVAAVGLMAGPAVAAPSADTVVTFDITAGTLDITAPPTASLPDGVSGGTITGQIGPVTVTDGRSSATPTWSVNVTSTDFTSGGGGTGLTIPAGDVDYWSGAATATTGDGTFTPGQATALLAVPLDNTTPITAFSHSGGTGDNSATWNPTLIVNVPLSAIAGTYSGTVTHSFA